MSIIEAKNFSFTYHDKKKAALKDINLKISDGEFVLLTGPSGSGKSTLIRSFNSLIPNFYGGVFEGEVNIQNYNVVDHPTRFFAKKVGMVFQNPDNQLFMNTVEAEIAFGMENLNFSKKHMKKKIEEILNAVAISNLKKRSISTLSGGEKQKVAIAAVLSMQPSIIILDEPTSELDPKSAEDILMLIQKLNEELGLTIILIEHRIERVIKFVDRMIIMDKGRIISDGNPRNIFSKEIATKGIKIPSVTQLSLYFLKNNLVDFKGKIPLTVKETRKLLHKYLVKINPSEIGRLKYDQTLNNYNKNFKNLTPLVEFTEVSFSYDKNKQILQKLDFKAYPGEFISIIGRNGSGKTTFIKQINGLLRPQAGSIKIKGKNIKNISIATISRDVGFLFQNPAIQFYHDTVLEEIQAILKNFKEDKIKIDKISTKSLKTFNLYMYKENYPRYLSLGEQQRVALASVLVTEPNILILDEPTHGMDKLQKDLFFNLVDDYRKKGNLVILVTHDIESVAEFSDRVLLLSDGEIILDDIKREVLSQALFFSPQINRLIRSYKNIPQNLLTAKEMIEMIEMIESA